jgi:branched-chain amino acid transport system permease protein
MFSVISGVVLIAIGGSGFWYFLPRDILLSVKPMVMVLLGGLGTLFGPVIGAAVFLVLEEAVWRSFLTVHAAVLGLLIVALVLFLPNGLMAIGRRHRRAGQA